MNYISSFTFKYLGNIGTDTYHLGVHFSLDIESTKIDVQGKLFRNYPFNIEELFTGSVIECLKYWEELEYTSNQLEDELECFMPEDQL